MMCSSNDIYGNRMGLIAGMMNYDISSIFRDSTRVIPCNGDTSNV
jgi:hypothetical protein